MPASAQTSGRPSGSQLDGGPQPRSAEQKPPGQNGPSEVSPTSRPADEPEQRVDGDWERPPPTAQQQRWDVLIALLSRSLDLDLNEFRPGQGEETLWALAIGLALCVRRRYPARGPGDLLDRRQHPVLRSCSTRHGRMPRFRSCWGSPSPCCSFSPVSASAS